LAGPRGSRDTINEAFLKDLAADWQENGVDALCKAREERPAEYCRMVANLLPKEARMELDVNTEASQAFLEALKELGRREAPRVIEGETKDCRVRRGVVRAVSFVAVFPVAVFPAIDWLSTQVPAFAF
jgi:hypothetical protein